ncbi:MAG TPA: phosphate ABC transporter permease PstA [Candidatus Dormibacteraeota bacterium]|nr:phosphate ABC transporter permease PstA [Candidatus Dormibacteraeota bacterium]
MTVRAFARLTSHFWWALSIAALGLIIAILLSIFAFVIVRGAPALRPALFTTVTSGVAGGLANAIAGTLLLVSIGLVIAGVVGVGTALWVVEYAPQWAARAVRYMIDVLAGVPSIVVGYFLYVALVEGLGWGFSLVAGALSLAIFVLPYVERSADIALTNVPRELREASVAMGARQGVTMLSIDLPYAMPGILTGLLVAIGIGLGETAPLIYTAGWSNYLPTLAPTHSPVGYLTYVVWTYISQPFAASHALAYAAATLLMVFVFATNLIARSFVEYRFSGRHSH